MQAAIGCAQLDKLVEFIEARKARFLAGDLHDTVETLGFGKKPVADPPR